MLPVIQCEDCWVRYGSNTVLEGIQLEVATGHTLCIVGPNGGGKSTLLKLVLGLVAPYQGRVRVLGDRPERTRHRIGYMPQLASFDPLFPITVESIVRMGRLRGRGFGFYRRADSMAAHAALEEVGMWAHRKELYSSLSGGMKQRVLIARAMVNDPELLLLDEPTAMVDKQGGADLLDHLRGIHASLSMIIVSHDAAFVSGLVDEVLYVNRTARLQVTPVQHVCPVMQA